MEKVIKSNLRQGIFSTKFLICAAAVTLVIYCSSVESLLDALRRNELLFSGFHVSFILRALDSEAILFITPIVAAVSMSGVYVEDIKTNYIRSYLFRSSRKPYIAGRIIGTYISGGLCLLAGILLAYFISALLFTPIEKAPEAGLENISGLREIVAKALPFFLSGGLWALFGLSMSSFMESKYISYASPFIAFYVLVVLHERYFDALYILSPKEWLVPSEKWFPGSWGPAVIVAELSILMALLFALKAEKRLSQL